MKTLATRTFVLTFAAALALAVLVPAPARAQFDSVTKITQDAEGNAVSDAGDEFGASVANLGADPLGALSVPQLGAVGAPGANDDAGAIYGLGLNSDGSIGSVTVGPITIAANGILATVPGDDPGDRFGAAFVATQSVTIGDAIAGGFVGAPGDDNGTGEAYIYSLNVNLTTFSIEVDREQTYNENIDGLSLSEGDRFGAAVDTLGSSLDGDDATTEVAIGAPGANTVHVLAVNQSDGTASVFTAIDGAALGSGDGFGSSIANLGDLTGDGNVEIAIGAEDANQVHLVSVNGSGEATLLGTYSGSGGRFGAGAGLGPTVDGDSTAVVGAPDDGAGTFTQLVATGSGYGRVAVVGSGDLPGTSLSSGDRFAESLAGIPEDLDGNGTGEVFAGAPGDGTNGDGAGAAYFLFPNQAALPVEFADAPTAAVDGRDVTLRWRTLSETRNAGFRVQHKRLGASSWKTAEQRVEAAGTTTAKNDYAFTVRGLAPGRYVFRVKQVDTDDEPSFSGRVNAEVGLAGFTLLPPMQNPFRGRTTLSYHAPGGGTGVEAALYNSLGQRVRRLKPVGGRIAVEAGSLSSGLYFVRLVTEEGRTKVQSLTLVR